MSGAYPDQELRRGARACWTECLGTGREEICLVVTDEEQLDLARVFQQEALAVGLQALLLSVGVLERHGQDLPGPGARLLQSVDCALLITAKSLTHTRARASASEAGVRIASMPMLTEEIVAGALVVDYSEIKLLSERLAEKLTGSSKAVIQTPAGTDLTLEIGGRSGIADTGILTERGAFGNLPAGEALIAPVEGKGFGRLVVDGAAAGVGLPQEPISIVVEDGRLVSVEGGTDAARLRHLLETADDNAFRIAELGIGTNSKAQLIGHPLVDEKVLGTVHVGVGNNLFMGGTQQSSTHLDLVMLQPRLLLDDIVVLEKDSILV